MVACSNQKSDPMITKEETQEPVRELLAKEEVQETPQAKQNLEIEFVLEDEIITLNTSNITILGAFLNTVTNKEVAISNMDLVKLEMEKLYLLTFNCSENNCSYLLLDRSEPNRSFLLDDLITVEEIIPSPDQSKLLFVINSYRNRTYKVFQLEDWKTVQYDHGLPDENISFDHVSWKDNKSIKMEYVSENNSNEIILQEKEEQLFE